MPYAFSNCWVWRVSSQAIESTSASTCRARKEMSARLPIGVATTNNSPLSTRLVLATTKYPAELIASSKETGVYTPEFPFEIAADYVSG